MSSPQGLVFERAFLDEPEEQRLLIERASVAEAEPLPTWLVPLRARGAALAGVDAAALVEALVQHYPVGATIGWHRDAPAFGLVVGISLGSAARLRFRRGSTGRWTTWELELAPRSAYVLAGEARRSWQHSIPPTKGERYSITFRTLRQLQ